MSSASEALYAAGRTQVTPVHRLSRALGISIAIIPILCVCEFFLPLRVLAQRYHAGSAGQVAAGRLFAILDAPAPYVPVASPTTGHGPIPRPPAVALDGVSYRECITFFAD